jgi:uncharacterized surface protein with fasciclin (FAS1) repeats
MYRRSPRLVAGLLALCVSSLTIVGCGTDSESSAGAPIAQQTTPPTPGAETAISEALAAPEESSSAPAAAAKVAGPDGNIFFTAVGAGSFLTLAKLLANADLIETIKGEGPFTVFAPTDTAFAAVPPETLKALLADKAKLKKVLLYHVVPGTVMASQLKAGRLKTAEGADLTLTDTAGIFTVNDANIAAPDVVASNGVIHVIDRVLLPPDL